MPTAEHFAQVVEFALNGDNTGVIAALNDAVTHDRGRGWNQSANALAALGERFARQRPAQGQFRDPAVQNMMFAVPPTENGLDDLLLPERMIASLRSVVAEHRDRARLREHGLKPTSKILCDGPPGTGKTMTAQALAKELGLSCFVVATSQLLSKYFSESGSNMDKAFKAVREVPGVYLFDEFDSLGAGRESGHGEERKVVNWLLRNLEGDTGMSVVMAATNMPKIIDRAAFRRFELRLQYTMPTEKVMDELLRRRFASARLELPKLPAGYGKRLIGVSLGDIGEAAGRVMRAAVMQGRQVLSGELHQALLDRRPPLKKKAKGSHNNDDQHSEE